MAYSATNWVDGTTPVDAERMNHIEGGVADLSDSIDELNSTISQLKAYNATLNVGTTYQILWNTGSSQREAFCLIFIRGRSGQCHLTLVLNGYGYQSARMAVNELTKGTAVSYEVEEENEAIDFLVTNSSLTTFRLAIVSLYGDLPTITAIS